MRYYLLLEVSNIITKRKEREMLSSLPYDLLLEILVYLGEEDISSLLLIYPFSATLWQDLISRKHTIRLMGANSLDYILLGNGLRNSLGNRDISSNREIIPKLLREEEKESKESYSYWTTTLKNPFHSRVRGNFFRCKTPSRAILSINRFLGEGKILEFLYQDVSFRYILGCKISSLIQRMEERLIQGELEQTSNLLLIPDPKFPSIPEFASKLMEIYLESYPSIHVYTSR